MFILLIFSLSCLHHRAIRAVKQHFPASLEWISIYFCVPPPHPHIICNHISSSLPDLLSKPSLVSRMTSHPALAYSCYVCHCLLCYTGTAATVWGKAWGKHNLSGQGEGCGPGRTRWQGEEGDKELLSALAKSRTSGAAGRFCSPRKWRGRKKTAITGIFLLLDVCNGRGKTTLPKRQNRRNFWVTFQMLSTTYQVETLH